MLEDQQNQVPPSGGDPNPTTVQPQTDTASQTPQTPAETPTQTGPASPIPQPSQPSIDPNLSLITSDEPGPPGNAVPENKSLLIPILIGAVVLLAVAFFLILTLTSKKEPANKNPVSVTTKSISSQEETQLITTESAATEDAALSETHLAATEETAEPTLDILTEEVPLIPTELPTQSLNVEAPLGENTTQISATTEIAPPEQTTPPAAATPRIKRTVSQN